MTLREKCNMLLESMVGPNLVEKWWDSPNRHWDMKTPNQQWEEDPKSVFKYLLSHVDGGW